MLGLKPFSIKCMVTELNKRVVVTRPLDQAESWCKHISNMGVDMDLEPLVLPMLEIVKVDQPEQINVIKNALLELDGFSILIFVSQNAVAHGFDWIETYWPQFPDKVACLAVGAKTQEALAERLAFYGRTLKVYAPSDAEGPMPMDSEALLSMPILQKVENEKILIFRGCGGRTKLFDELSSRGAIVSYCELYDRNLPQRATEQYSSANIDVKRDIVTVFSGETLQNFHRVLQASPPENWSELAMVVPSRRVADQARSMGYEQVVAAVNATEPAMWQAVKPFLIN